MKMQQGIDSGDELLRKLSTVLRKHENPILRGEIKLCLTSTSLVYLNCCFKQLNSGSKRQNTTEVQYSEPSSPCVAYLHDLTRRALSLKIVPGPCPKFDFLLNISQFKNLQFLEIKKVPLGYILGLQSLRNQLKGLTCMRSAFALNEVFVCCGGDLSSTPFLWQQLRQVNLSYNSINHLDDSLKVLPAVESLNLSHNNIASPEEEDYWQFLTGLHYLNLGYNQLHKVPSLPAVSITRFQLKILILRNNNIQNLRGIQHFGLLETLDVSNNCITSFQELFPLAHLHNLSVLRLAGNPVCFYEDYRVNTVSCLSPVPHQGDMYLDNEKLSPLEKSFVGSLVQPASLLSYIPYQPDTITQRNLRRSLDSSPVTPGSSQDFSSQSLVVPTAERKKKKSRKPKTRQISIDKDVDEDSRISASSCTSSLVEQPLDHSQDIERLEKARDLGGAHWLPAINNVLHGETTSTPSKTSSYQEDKLSDISNTPPYVVSRQDVAVDVSLPLSRKSSSSESYQSDEGVNQPFLVTSKTLHTTDQEEEEDRDLLVTITEHFIRERDCDNGKVICKLEIGSLLAANLEESEDGDMVVHLKFDYLSRDRKERYYIMEDKESCEQLIEVLFPSIMYNEEAKNVILSDHLQCLKCSAYFTEQTSKSRDTRICPDCGSTKIIEVNPFDRSRDLKIDSPEEKLSNGTKTNMSTENKCLSEGQKMPDVIPAQSDGSSVHPQPDIYDSYSKEYIPEKQNENDSPDEIAERKMYAINNTRGFNINDSVHVHHMNQSSNDEQNKKESSKKSVENKKNATYSINKDAGFVVYGRKKDFQTKSFSPSRTSVLSNSIKDSDSLVPKSMGSRSELGKVSQRRVIDSPITLKTSSSRPSTLEPVGPPSAPPEETSFQRKTPTSQSKILPSSPASQPNVIMNLFSKLSNKMSGPLLSSSLNSTQDAGHNSTRSKSPVVTSCLYEISPDKFKDCDHRLKLYFEVSLFTGGSDESLYCLIKAPVVVYNDTEETCALLVVSNKAIYICKLVESAGPSAAECLSLMSSHSLQDLHYVDFGVGNQGFRLEFHGESPGCYTFIVRDKTRCETFLHLLIKTANWYRASQDFEPLKTTRNNPQTIHHIRSQVLGAQKEDLCSMGERYLQLLNHFTDPPLIKDRKSLLRSYPSCFVGKEFIDWLLRYGEANTRQEAVDLAQSLVDGGVIEHVSKESKFEDREQFYRFITNEGKTERSDSTENDDVSSESQMVLCDIDTQLKAVIMVYRILDTTQPLRDLKPVTIIVTRTHIALAEQNPQWPFPRYLESAPTVSGPQFRCIAKYKMTDVTGLDFFSDSPCHVAILISEEDAPLECADSYLLIKTVTSDSLSSLVKAIKPPWEKQFGVELQTSFLPTLEKNTALS